MKGADQCPKCGSRKHGDVEQAVTSFYGRTLRVCGNCGTAWEPFDPADLLDDDIPTSSFREPCDNCAFRPGSPEQEDKARWQKIVGDIQKGGAFYCHKGVPLTPGEGNGFAYPHDAEGKPIIRKLRLCRGYLMMWRARMSKEQAA